MDTSWIVVADPARARVLSQNSGARRLLVVHKLENPAARRLSQQLVTDEAGRIEKSGQGVLSAMDPHTNPHDYEAIRFAEKLASLLEDALRKQKYSRLTLVAPPHFLGLLRSSISNQVRKRLIASSRKDLTRLAGNALLQHLQNLRA